MGAGRSESYHVDFGDDAVLGSKGAAGLYSERTPTAMGSRAISERTPTAMGNRAISEPSMAR